MKSTMSKDEVRQKGNGDVIMPDRPYSLYMQNAGFLWTDEAVWDPHLLSFGQDQFVRKQIQQFNIAAEPAYSNHRVVFKDRIKVIGMRFYISSACV